MINKKLFPLVLLIPLIAWFVIPSGSLTTLDKWIDSLNEDSLINLDDENSCFYLRSDMTLLQKDPDFPTTEESLRKGAPEGSVMHVDSTNFDPEPYFNTCSRFEGYVIRKDGTKKWVLTNASTFSNRE